METMIYGNLKATPPDASGGTSQGGTMKAIALPNGSIRKFGTSAKDYVQDGLVAMWDGIENAGWGTHDASATTWVDLINNYPTSFVGSNLQFEDNNLHFTNGDSYLSVGGTFGSDLVAITSAGYMTVEVVISNEYGGYTNAGILGFGTSSKRTLWCYVDNQNSSQIKSALFQVQGSSAIRFCNDFSPTILNNSVHTISVCEDNGLCNSFFDSEKLSITTDIVKGTSATNTPMYIGYISGYNKYKGRIFQIRIYNRILPAVEFAYNCAIDKARFGI